MEDFPIVVPYLQQRKMYLNIKNSNPKFKDLRVYTIHHAMA
jgi:hypothetical protein